MTNRGRKNVTLFDVLLYEALLNSIDDDDVDEYAQYYTDGRVPNKSEFSEESP